VISGILPLGTADTFISFGPGSRTIKGRALRVSHLAGTKLKGSYVLNTGTRRAVISIR
jgi:hypothetical protein